MTLFIVESGVNRQILISICGSKSRLFRDAEAYLDAPRYLGSLRHRRSSRAHLHLRTNSQHYSVSSERQANRRFLPSSVVLQCRSDACVARAQSLCSGNLEYRPFEPQDENGSRSARSDVREWIPRLLFTNLFVSFGCGVGLLDRKSTRLNSSHSQ